MGEPATAEEISAKIGELAEAIKTAKAAKKPKDEWNGEYLVTDAVHYIQDSTEFPPSEMWRALEPERMTFPEEVKDDYSVHFGAIPKMTQFRSKHTAPWPEVPGLLTAKVTGPAGEEIFTDEYGRIKVKFHWDRVSKKDDDKTQQR